MGNDTDHTHPYVVNDSIPYLWGSIAGNVFDIAKILIWEEIGKENERLHDSELLSPIVNEGGAVLNQAAV